MVQLSHEIDTIQFELNGKYNLGVYKYCSRYQCDDAGQTLALYVFSSLGFLRFVREAINT